MWPLGRKQAVRPKSYLYVSDAKVDMLIEGLPARLRSKFDLKVTVDPSALLGTPGAVVVEGTPRHQPEGRFARAERLCFALEEQGRVGSPLDMDTELIRGEMMMTWGFWNQRHGGFADVVGFGGFADERACVFLGGSAYHTMERSAERLQQYSNSGLQQLARFFMERHGAQAEGRTGLPGAWYSEAWDADHDNPMVPERLEFVAQRLMDDADNSWGVRTILGSPIYVARSAQLPTRGEIAQYRHLRNEMLESIYSDDRVKKIRNGERWQVGKPSAPKLQVDWDLSPDLDAETLD